MKACQISRHGGPNVFKMIELPSSELKPQEVRIAVKACGVNFADIMMRTGMYPEAPKPPFVPGYEISGTVLEVGSAVTHFRKGDRVLAGCRFGGYTSEYVAEESSVRRIPDRMTEIEAAAIPVNFITAWAALVEMARVRKGDRVLIPSAAGGVGIAATQIAAQAGAEVTGLVGSPTKFDAVRALGARHMMTNGDWEKGADADLGGFDIILDATAGESLKRAMKRLAPAGRIVAFGAASMVTGQKRSLISAVRTLVKSPIYTPFKLMMENKGIYGLNVLKLFAPEHQKRMSRMFDDLMARFEAGDFKVIVGKTFPLEKAGEAHSYLQGRGNIGKVVLIP